MNLVPWCQIRELHIQGNPSRSNACCLLCHHLLSTPACTYVCMHVCICVCMHISVERMLPFVSSPAVHTYMYICMYVCVCMCMHISVERMLHFVPSPAVFVCIHVYICVCRYIYIYICVRACAYVCICMYLCVYIYLRDAHKRTYMHVRCTLCTHRAQSSHTNHKIYLCIYIHTYIHVRCMHTHIHHAPYWHRLHKPLLKLAYEPHVNTYI